MAPVPILAHGALGVFDELIFLGVALVFLALMGITWYKARNAPPDLDDAPADSSPQTESKSPERFRLE